MHTAEADKLNFTQTATSAITRLVLIWELSTIMHDSNCSLLEENSKTSWHISECH